MKEASEGPVPVMEPVVLSASSSLTPSTLRAALVKHKVPFFRDQDITPAQRVALARRLGELKVYQAFAHRVLPAACR
ncbi:hypothetical protein LMG27952_07510 [Paraburkholderia hiiakae]|uniref:Uncharacterized protein n=1 Tax=Paraburkholderia hiiakae TaxID=1081782 RepID=A0ABM8PB56_9BURK|nr:hypothetical protein LMG27952_07510 [Paraburkholderia hiiakae]